MTYDSVTRFKIRSLFILITLCALILAIFPRPPVAKTTVYDDLSQFPMIVQSIIKQLERIPGGCTLDEFERELKKIGSVKVPCQHHKDFEFYWAIDDVGLLNAPHFIVAGNFAPYDGHRLTHATVVVIEAPSDVWRTIWLADYASDTPDFLAPKIRGQAKACK